MIRFLRAFAWLRWRLAVQALRGTRRRDALEQFSRFSALVVPTLFFVLILGFSALLGLLGFIGGRSVGRGSVEAISVLAAPRVLLLLVIVSMVLIPSGGTTVAGHTRLLLLPIPRQTLHLLEVLTSAAGPWVASLVPGLFLFATGLLIAGATGASAVAFAAAGGMIAFMASLNTVLASFTNWILRNRRRSEVVALVAVLVFSVAGVVPTLMSDKLEVSFRADGSSGHLIEKVDSGLPAWSRAIPSELYGHSIGMAVDGHVGSAWLGVALLFAEAAALYALSALVHRKLLESSESGRGRRRTDPVRTSTRRIPGLTPAASAIAIAQARTALRSVRGRVVVMLPGPVVAILGICSRRLPGAFPGGDFLGSHGYALLGAGMVFSMYALLAFTMNQFASDRAGLSLQLLAPIREVDLVRGKAVGCALILTVAVLICLVVALVVCPGGSPLVWISVLLGGAATYMFMSPIAALMSALFPVASDLSKSGNGGNPHGLAMLAGTLLVLSLSSVPGLILSVVDHTMQHPGLSFVLILLWTAIAAVVSIPLLGLAARAVTPRRENLVLVARGR